MNREAIILSVKRVLSDGPFLVVVAQLIVVGTIYCLMTSFNIHPSDVTVYSRYTAFGEEHFDNAHWRYLILFVGFGMFVTFAHLALMIKMHNLDRRQTAALIGYLGTAILLIASAYALSVMQLGRSS